MNHNLNNYNDPWDKHKKQPYTPWGPDIHKDSYQKWQTEKPKIVTIADLFPRLDRLSIGWSPLLDQLKEITSTKPTYPPYDIVQTEDDVNLLNVAVAGFAKEELSVIVQDSGTVLGIGGKKSIKQQGEVVYQGIAARDFYFELAIAEFWKITEAAVKDGMLTITLKKELPEEKKPKVIDIK
jgi:molecular chaperone IbpA